MDSETWNLWLLYRPLFAFLMACPLLIVPALIGWIKQRRDEKRQSEAKAEHWATTSGAASTRARGPVAPAKPPRFERRGRHAAAPEERLSVY